MRPLIWLWAAGLFAQTVPLERVPSPDGRLGLEYRDCRQTEPCKADLRVTDREGRTLHYLSAPAERFERVFWIGSHRLGFELKVSPSTHEFVELDRETGNERQRLLGLWFTPSPDLKWVAHAGFMVHFAPPSATGGTVEVNDLVLYPLPKGGKPVIRRNADAPPAVITCKDTGVEMQEVCSDIHDIHPSLAWSPDSRHVGFVETVSTVRQTWSKESGSADAEYLKSECFAGIVALDGRVRRLALESEDCWQRKVKWIDNRSLETDTGKKLAIP